MGGCLIKILNNLDSQEKIELYVREVIQPLLPKATAGDWFGTGETIKLHLDKFQLFKETPFECDEVKDFIHFTSISNLVQIILNKSILLSDFNLFRDRREFRFANEWFDNRLGKPEYNELKSQFFAFSMCALNYERVKSKEMWRRYGGNGKGVCIHFSLDPKRLYYNFFLGKVQYAENRINELISLKQRHRHFFKKHGWTISNGSEMLGVISSFYKREKFSDEQEYRLLKYVSKADLDCHSFEKNQQIHVIHDDKKDIFKYRYVLPLEDDLNGSVTINRISFKYGPGNNALGHIYSYLQCIFKEKFNREILLESI